jgi:hypothetical protein
MIFGRNLWSGGSLYLAVWRAAIPLLFFLNHGWGLNGSSQQIAHLLDPFRSWASEKE